MKKLISTVFVACIGGIAALTATHFIYGTKQISQVTQPNSHQPITLVNSSGMMGGALTTDFTNAAEKSVNAVVHIKTISENVNNLSYDPFAELFFGPQKRQEVLESAEGSRASVPVLTDTRGSPAEAASATSGRIHSAAIVAGARKRRTPVIDTIKNPSKARSDTLYVSRSSTGSAVDDALGGATCIQVRRHVPSLRPPASK